MNRFQRAAADVAALDDRSQMVFEVAGDSSGAAWVRGELQVWLLRHFSTSEQRHGGVLLAVNEALANAVEFGYRHWVDRGIIASAAAYDDHTHTLNVTATDGGRWRLGAAIPPTTVGHCPRRGRGLPLMRALADELRIVTSERGTEVSLVWTELR